VVSRFEVVLGFGGGAAMTTQATADVPDANDAACIDRTITLMLRATVPKNNWLKFCQTRRALSVCISITFS
jgi:hypothetical protein